MLLKERIELFVKLGEWLVNVSDNQYLTEKENTAKSSFEKDKFRMILQKSEQQNAWFTPENIIFACQSWGKLLTKENITQWLSKYRLTEKPSKKIALILAGNIPLVGFHDFLSVIISGNEAIIKQSSNDKVLLPFLVEKLIEIAPQIQQKITFTQEKLTDYDAIIATGSNNTARYFEYYFGKSPNIIRKNRNSVAILTGNESQEELKLLGSDIFTYFGLGCRSVSKIFVPENYDFTPFFNAMYSFHPIINHLKYVNNYDYNKAVYLMSRFQLQENGFLILKEESSYSSPIGTLFYEFYTDKNQLLDKLSKDKENIQCVVSKGITEKEIPFGQTQNPQLWQYADEVDTIEFLQNI